MTFDMRKAEFVKSAASPGDFLSDLPQVTFAGRSNVGKSSVLNCLMGRKNFARVGSEPGKTAHINYFRIDRKFYVTDLPGYGYAKVSMAERDRWARLMESYFKDSGRLTMGVMVVDARHAPSKDDVTMAEWFRNTGCPLAVCVNKTDKLKKSELEGCPGMIRDTLGLDASSPLILFSALKGTGRDELIRAIAAGLRG